MVVEFVIEGQEEKRPYRVTLKLQRNVSGGIDVMGCLNGGPQLPLVNFDSDGILRYGYCHKLKDVFPLDNRGRVELTEEDE